MRRWAIIIALVIGAMLLVWDIGHGIGPSTTEDSPSWNCMTMGNKRCGTAWQDWHEYDGHADCRALVADTTRIVCSDGFVTTS